jgi:carboxyl-terminal processing protease
MTSPLDNLTTTEVADLLKGPRGTAVQIVIAREGSDKPIIFNVIRDEISRKSVQDAIWLKRDAGIAYMNIESFNETTSPEIEENLKRLGENNIKGLILDLRFNPGGLLNEGVAVGDRFLRKGQVIVSHRGRSSPEKTYTAKKGNGNHDYPMVVLVNRLSASAAEIVSGARKTMIGLIMGETPSARDSLDGISIVETWFLPRPSRYHPAMPHPAGSQHLPFDYYNHKDLDSKNLRDVKMTDVPNGLAAAAFRPTVRSPAGPFQLTGFCRLQLLQRYFGSRHKLPVIGRIRIF